MPSSATRLKAVEPKKSKPVPQNAHTTLSPRSNTAIACLLLAVATLSFYNPVAHCGFVYSDDIAYVTRNPQVRAGLTWATVQWAFGGIHTGFWHPLTWLSHALDCQLFGLNPTGHHYVSLLLHTGSSILLFLILLEATGAAWPSLMVAGSVRPASGERGVGGVGRGAQERPQHVLMSCRRLWTYGRYVRQGGDAPLPRSGRALCRGVDGQNADRHPALRDAALGLLASAQNVRRTKVSRASQRSAARRRMFPVRTLRARSLIW